MKQLKQTSEVRRSVFLPEDAPDFEGLGGNERLEILYRKARSDSLVTTELVRPQSPRIERLIQNSELSYRHELERMGVFIRLRMKAAGIPDPGGIVEVPTQFDDAALNILQNPLRKIGGVEVAVELGATSGALQYHEAERANKDREIAHLLSAKLFDSASFDANFAYAFSNYTLYEKPLHDSEDREIPPASRGLTVRGTPRLRRTREELPAPEKPSWARENRLSPDKGKMLSLRVDEWFLEAVDEMARREGVSRSLWIRRQFLRAAEDAELEIPEHLQSLARESEPDHS